MKIMVAFVCLTAAAWAVVFGSLRGVIHDPDHRPISGAEVSIKSLTSDFVRTASTAMDGSFEVTSIPVGAYKVTITHEGFAAAAQETVVTSGSAPVLHFQLAIGTVTQSVNVSEEALSVNPEQMTPAVIVSRQESRTPQGRLSRTASV